MSGHRGRPIPRPDRGEGRLVRMSPDAGNLRAVAPRGRAARLEVLSYMQHSLYYAYLEYLLLVRLMHA